MADAERIYPANEDVENATHEDAQKSPPASAPLRSKSSLMSKRRDPAANPGPAIHVQFPKDQMIPTREAPRYYSPPPKRRRNLCCRCVVCASCLLLLLIVVIAIAAAILYAVLQPRIPKYSVENIQITSFAVSGAATVSSQFEVDMTAKNPNKKIGLYYLDDSYLAVFYTGTELCRGRLPAFFQGHKSTTNLDVTLSGTNVQMTNKMITSLNAEQQQGNIPLRLMADVPVKVKLGKLKSIKITFSVRCDLVVDKLAANTRVNISKKECKVKV